MKYKFKNVLVYGASISGEWACKLLLKLKANVFLFDDNIESLKRKILKGCYILQELNENLISQFDFIVVSPSIEKDNKFLQFAKKYDVPVCSEIGLASLFCKNYVAVTGTNGKTTTVELITKILSKKCKAVACGNNGYPVSRAVLENKKSIKVMEVSSFMLEHLETFKPKVATVLNISPDHLVRHKTMEEYANLKINIFKNLDIKSFAVVNLDNQIKPNNNTMLVTYSYNKTADVYVKNGYIFIRSQKLMALNELPLKGKHNVYNVMCAICYGLIYKVSPQKIKQAILEFKPESFRIEYIGKINGINFVNDSKSTNIASTLASVETVKGSIILLLGGSNKSLNYELLFSKLSKRVKLVLVYGEIAEELAKSNNQQFKMQTCFNLNEAFDYAVNIAKPNDTILLSPATASYDQFKNYIERGKAFNLKVKEYEKASKQK